jgi:hypothetical protein
MIRRRRKTQSSAQNAVVAESPQAAFARYRRTELGREVMRYNDHVPEIPSSKFLARFVDFPFDIAAKFAALNSEGECVLRDSDVVFMRTQDAALRDALSQPASIETHVMNTRDAIRRARASISADALVPAEVKPVMIHGLDAGRSQVALTNPRVTGHLPKPALVEIRQDFMDDDSFELFRLVLDARYAPQIVDEAQLTAPEWVRQKYLPLFYSRQAVLVIAMSLPFPNANAWRAQRAEEVRRRDEQERVRAQWRDYWLSVTDALFHRQPRLARQLRSTPKGEVAAVVDKVVTMRSSVDPKTGEHYSYRRILHDFGRAVNREEINMSAHKQLVILNQIIDALRADEANVRRDQALGLLLEIHDESRSSTR